METTSITKNSSSASSLDADGRPDAGARPHDRGDACKHHPRAMVHVLGAPLSAWRRIDIEPLSITDFRSNGHRWMLRASGVTSLKPAKVT